MAKVTMEIKVRIMNTVEVPDEIVEAYITADNTKEAQWNFANVVKEKLNVDHVEVTGVKHFVLDKVEG